VEDLAASGAGAGVSSIAASGSAIESNGPTELLERIRALIGARQAGHALALAEQASTQFPDSRDVLLGLAMCQRQLGRLTEALATLDRLEAVAPRFTRLYQERGQCLAALREPERAVRAFEQAVHLCPALPVSWKSLEALYRRLGRLEDADNAAAHVRTLAGLPRDVVLGTMLLADGETHSAERLVRAFLLRTGDDIEAMRLLARIGLQLDVLDDAELLLRAVLDRAPEYRAARYDYAIVLLRRHRHRAAEAEIHALLAEDPANRQYRTTEAAIALGLGRYREAYERYASLLQETPDDPELDLSVAHALKTLGRTPEAIDAYRAAIAAKADYGEAYWSLANLKTYRFDAAEITAMRRIDAAPSTSLVDRYHVSFALGKALEDRRDYANSFACYQRGNALKRSEQPYDPAVIDDMVRRQRAVCTPELFAARRDTGCPSPAPIFIVGLPRSGSTLLEQILSSHPLVEGTTELSEIPRLVQRLQGRGSTQRESRYPAIVGELRADELREIGEQYLEDASAYRSTERPFFIDKNPNNFRHLGLIRLALPNAKVIDARRGAMACCFSNFKQLFATGQRFTYDLGDVGRYYRSYVDLMEHWNTALPDWVLRVRHENVVADFEPNVRRLLAYCGLDFDPACLEFYRTDRGVNTPSAEQVRQPINRDGIDQWRHYSEWLDPLRDALGPLAET